jgi:hypothetical protein
MKMNKLKKMKDMKEKIPHTLEHQPARRGHQIFIPSENEVGQAESRRITAPYAPQIFSKKCCFPQLDIVQYR